MLLQKSTADNASHGWVSSAYRWWSADEFDMAVLRGVVYRMKNVIPRSNVIEFIMNMLMIWFI